MKKEVKRKKIENPYGSPLYGWLIEVKITVEREEERELLEKETEEWEKLPIAIYGKEVWSKGITKESKRIKTDRNWRVWKTKPLLMKEGESFIYSESIEFNPLTKFLIEELEKEGLGVEELIKVLQHLDLEWE